MKRLLPLLIPLFVLLLVYLVSPLPAVQGIRKALRAEDGAALARHVDFPALQANLRAQTEDYIARQAAPGMRDNPFGAFALAVAGRMAGGLAETAATPEGVRMLMAGRVMWRKGTASGLELDKPLTTRPPEDPFRDARYRLESHDRFSAQLPNDGGMPVEVVLYRQGLKWKVGEINLGTQGPVQQP
ncbi:DUF2939 domain-containing protein [Marilutibacter alkalisoli]|uniref:DUF2939 domain-containing protein n=1 Tax=Marilutibacter alkalisoli TaxID=2591633 RepID=A0A514BRL3_9GAMM|nr:DUF2939 domain-containing protein [Lysobacter alkalisoli]QDH69955.1 DUF2939 domain-containing protein [Lysobacter alkalisoli]